MIAAFSETESLIATRQRSLAAESGNIWEGWRNVPEKIFATYGDLIAGGKFDDVKKLINLM